MKRILSTLLAALALVPTIASCASARIDLGKSPSLLTKTVPVRKSLSDINPDAYAPIVSFTNTILEKLAKENNGMKNTVFSPLSAYLALAMVKEGAHGKTLAQMNECMGEIEPYTIQKLIAHLTSLDTTTLKIGDSVWIDNSIAGMPKSEYLDTIAKYYLAECYKATLADSEDEVNAWIEDKTDGMLKNLLDEAALDSSVMALINTVYMNAAWKHEFSKELLEDDFRGSDGTVKKTDFMQRFGEYERVFETDSLIGVTLSYSDNSLVFAAVLPKDETLNASDAAMLVCDGGGWISLTSSAEKKKANILLPKFELESGFALNDILRSMGITEAFGDDADFRGITSGIRIDGVMQTAKIRLDEKGTEAAAATVVTMVPTSLAPDNLPLNLIFNRPFAFAVIDNTSGTVLFSGEYNKAQ